MNLPAFCPKFWWKGLGVLKVIKVFLTKFYYSLFRVELSLPSSGALMCSHMSTLNDAFKNTLQTAEFSENIRGCHLL